MAASRFLGLIAILALPALSGCAVLRLGAMDAAGPIAEAQRNLYFLLAIVLIFVAGPVLVLTPLIAWHYRISNKHSTFRPKWVFSWWLEGLIWIPPAGIVIGLSFLLWNYTQRLDPYRPIAASQPPLEIQAVALDWKWLFIYPEEHIAAMNELAIPVSRPVRISLTSGTVMQAMLIPRLAGQIYAMAGMRTELNLAASQPGVYRGGNVQFNGTGFAKQKFDVIALSPSDYEGWLAAVRAAANPLDPSAYAQLFEKTTPAQPILFSSAPEGLFQKILSRYQDPDMKVHR
ncbi:MAG: COX aromatic rich motif-containing protein [Beijerinckiaceae bacterium]|nr:COX aromatic rich motif-containing protein [Beijerinckiaceae bacterium]